MSSKERRVSPRKDCVMPLRFRITAKIEERKQWPEHANIVGDASGLVQKISSYFGTLEGEAVNLSERGIYFRSRERVHVGEPLEMYFTIPRELTGRLAEHVRCTARVVHVDSGADQQGMLGVGAAVERFEPVSAAHDWGN